MRILTVSWLFRERFFFSFIQARMQQQEVSVCVLVCCRQYNLWVISCCNQEDLQRGTALAHRGSSHTSTIGDFKRPCSLALICLSWVGAMPPITQKLEQLLIKVRRSIMQMISRELKEWKQAGTIYRFTHNTRKPQNVNKCVPYTNWNDNNHHTFVWTVQIEDFESCNWNGNTTSRSDAIIQYYGIVMCHQDEKLYYVEKKTYQPKKCCN